MSTYAISTIAIATFAAMCCFVGCTSVGTDRPSMGAVSGYICPLTGETLPCPDCCPLNQEQASHQEMKNTAAASKGDGYECPLTGEILPCPKCCPLNKGAN